MKRLALIAAACALLGVGTAHADKKASQLFEKGKKLLEQKEYASACAAFESSDEMEPGIGVKLNAGRCFEEWGKLARAYRWYNDAKQLAADSKDPRAQEIEALMKALDQDVPKLTLKLTAGGDPATAAVELDSKLVAVEYLGSAMRVDPGPHELTWKSGARKRSKTIAFERGGKQEVLLEVKAGGAAADDGDPTTDDGGSSDHGPRGQDPGHGRRVLGLAVAGVGVLGLGVAGYLTVTARGDYQDALDAHCMGMSNACDQEGLDITHRARHRANLATGVAIGAALVVAGGVVLYVTAPKAGRAKGTETAIYLAPIVSGDGGGFALGGGF